MMWTQIRITAYVTAIIAGLATLAAAFGFGSYDAATGVFDPAPFSLSMIVGLVAPIIASAVAAVAAKLGWGRKP